MKLPTSVAFIFFLIRVAAAAHLVEQPEKVSVVSFADVRKKLQEEDGYPHRALAGSQLVDHGGFDVRDGGEGRSPGAGDGRRRHTRAIKRHHRLPGIHEDYYGPRNYVSKHH